ncbi:hypothetical protein [Bifidobacterium aemilianum]|nr:hypothetical protein [Bifidobacterium aemilianum]
MDQHTVTNIKTSKGSRTRSSNRSGTGSASASSRLKNPVGGSGRPAAGLPVLLGLEDLTGPLSLHRLALSGTVKQLDDSSIYHPQDADTLYGRGSIISSIIPQGTMACATTASWVWLGGPFPNSIDLVSNSHFRSTVYGRPIRLFNRACPPGHVSHIGDLAIISPVRTACDLALLPVKEAESLHANELISALMQDFGFQPQDCLRLLHDCRYWPGSPRARSYFTRIKGCY